MIKPRVTLSKTQLKTLLRGGSLVVKLRDTELELRGPAKTNTFFGDSRIDQIFTETFTEIFGRF
jgi:hypothetical protein